MPDCVHVDVTDEGPGFTTGPHPEHPGRDGGWGLFLVDELAAAWASTTTAGRTSGSRWRARQRESASDGTRTRDLRRDRPAF